ncbi:MAG: CoA transferase subunit A, partial [Acidobacteria bacterium]
YYSRDNDFFRAYHVETKTSDEFERWRSRWVDGVRDRSEYLRVLESERVDGLKVKKHSYSAPADYGY